VRQHKVVLSLINKTQVTLINFFKGKRAESYEEKKKEEMKERPFLGEPSVHVVHLSDKLVQGAENITADNR
jgi:hypothetical protein